MRNENIVEAIESQLADAIELGMNTEEALADTAGLLSEAEARFVRLSHPAISLPPPARA
jgi:tryptophan synthase alpha subunit